MPRLVTVCVGSIAAEDGAPMPIIASVRPAYTGTRGHCGVILFNPPEVVSVVLVDGDPDFPRLLWHETSRN